MFSQTTFRNLIKIYRQNATNAISWIQILKLARFLRTLALKIRQTVATISALAPLFLNSFHDPWYYTCFEIIRIYFRVIFLWIIGCTINITPTEIISFYLGIKTFCVIPLALRCFFNRFSLRSCTLYNDFIQYVPPKRQRCLFSISIK